MKYSKFISFSLLLVVCSLAPLSVFASEAVEEQSSWSDVALEATKAVGKFIWEVMMSPSSSTVPTSHSPIPGAISLPENVSQDISLGATFFNRK